MQNNDGAESDRNVRLKHPDLPTLVHAVLVFMVGIGVLFYASQWVSGVGNKILELLAYLVIPLWACYLFQFDLRRTFFLRFPGWRSWLGIILGAAGMFAFLSGLESVLWSVPALQPSPEELERLREQFQNILGKDIWTMVLFAVVAVPVCEEFLFRGFFLRATRESLNIYVSVIVVGIFFGILHQPLISKILISIFGMYLGCVVWLSKSIVTSTIIHMLHNYVVLLASGGMVVETQPEPSFTQLPLFYKTIGAVTVVLVISASLYLFYTDDPTEPASRKERPLNNEFYHLLS